MSKNNWRELFGVDGERQIRALKTGEKAQVRSKNTGSLVQVTCIFRGRAYEIKRLEKGSSFVCRK